LAEDLDADSYGDYCDQVYDDFVDEQMEDAS
jgi:hypothetical protein